jgi:hypothetical protein
MKRGPLKRSHGLMVSAKGADIFASIERGPVEALLTIWRSVRYLNLRDQLSADPLNQHFTTLPIFKTISALN